MNPRHARTVPSSQPWICPRCAHFAVTDTAAPHHPCPVSRRDEALVAYRDTAQADAIRRRRSDRPDA